jgi:hypothetical protein
MWKAIFQNNTNHLQLFQLRLSTSKAEKSNTSAKGCWESLWKCINLLTIPSGLSRSYSTFPLCSWTTLIEIAVYKANLPSFVQKIIKSRCYVDLSPRFRQKSHPKMAAWERLIAIQQFKHEYTKYLTSLSSKFHYDWPKSYSFKAFLK